MKKLLPALLVLLLALASCKKEQSTDNDGWPTVTGVSPSAVTAGMIVTVTGTNFGKSIANVMVYFNGVEAAVQSVTPTQIKVIVPVTTSGVVEVSVGTTGGVYTSASGPAYIYNGPFATITGISPLIGTSGTLVTLTGTNFGTSVTAVQVLFNGISATVRSVTPTEIKAYVPVTTSGNITITVGNQSASGPFFIYGSPYLMAAYVSGDVRLVSQAQVDTFARLNKGKQLQITGDFSVAGSDVTDLSGLSNITAISGKLSLISTSLTDMNGFSALQTLGSLTLYNNIALINLHGLEQLTNLTAPEILDPSNTGGYIQFRMSGITIFGNPKLTSIAALQNVTVASIIYFTGNASLNDFCPLKGPIISLSTQPGHPYLTGIYTVTFPALTLTNNGNYATTQDALAAVALCK